VGRKPREFSRAEIDDLVGLFDEGYATERIGQLRGLSGTMVRRVLKAELGDLRTAKAIRKARETRGPARMSQRRADAITEQLGQQRTSKEYREGFEAGVRQALTWTELHGVGAVRTHCNEALLPWRNSGEGAPPAL